MWEAAVGDVVIHYSDQKIVALSTVLTSATSALRPYDSTPGLDWVEEGKQIVVSLTRLEAPIRKDEIPLDIRREASKNHGPFTEKGEGVKQGYFFPVPQVLWDYLSGVIGAETQTNDVGGSSASSPVSGNRHSVDRCGPEGTAVVAQGTTRWSFGEALWNMRSNDAGGVFACSSHQEARRGVGA